MKLKLWMLYIIMVLNYFVFKKTQTHHFYFLLKLLDKYLLKLWVQMSLAIQVNKVSRLDPELIIVSEGYYILSLN